MEISVKCLQDPTAKIDKQENNTNQFDEATLKLMRRDINNVLAKYGDDKGMKFFVGNIQYVKKVASINVSASFKDAPKFDFDKDADMFRKLAKLYDLSVDDLNKHFKRGRVEYKVIGLNPWAKKIPIIAVDGNGKKCKFSHVGLKEKLY